MKFLSYKWRTGPLKIKSLKELEPGFKPRWFRIEFRFVLIVFVSMPTLLAGSIFELYWLLLIGIAGIVVAALALMSLTLVPATMRFVGYWWPWMGLKAAELDSWLERDLDWGN